MLNHDVVDEATATIGGSNLFISIGTSGVVWSAAGYPQIAKNNGAYCIEVNPEPNEMSNLYDRTVREPAGSVLPTLFADSSG